MERFIPRLPDKQEIPPIEKRWIIGEAAASLEKQWRIQRSLGNADTFLNELITIVTKDQDKLPSLFTSPGMPINGKRQPSFAEAVTETAKRLKIVEKLAGNAPESVEGIVVGGSVSYGKFYCVRGAPDPSDIDLFYIVDPNFFTREETSKAFSSIGINESQVERFRDRADHFPELFNAQKSTLMSEKFQIENFVLSVKILLSLTFQDEFDTGLASAINGKDNQIKPVLDYKHSFYALPSFTQYNFLGDPHMLPVIQNLQKDGSSIVDVPSIIVINGHLYTGDHHNHIFPKCEIMLDRNGDIEQTIHVFESRLLKRAEQEREFFKTADINVLNAHDRKNAFSPQVLEEARRKFQ